MSSHQIHVFISHAWDHSGHYNTLDGWIFGEPWSVGQASLDLRNYSIPRSDPIHNVPNTEALRQAIFRQIKMSHIVVIPNGMYASHSAWIEREVEGALSYGKPILSVSPWGQERKSSIVVDNAKGHAGWNKQTVINEIWRLHYHS